MTPEQREVLARALADEVVFVNLQFTDVVGIIKSVTLPVQRLEEAFDRGIWFDGSSIEGFTRIQESDMFLVPDASTYRVLPWGAQTGKVARLICDIYTPAGDPFEGDPRRILRRMVEQAQGRGYTYNTGVELEFYLFTPQDGRIVPAPHDVGGYFDFSPRDEAALVRQDITRALESMGMEVEMIHHEVGPGQHEIDFKYADALTSADNAVSFRYTVKAIAQRHGLYATFMPKPMFGRAGSGMHTHQSLFKDGQNAFYRADDPYKLSPLAYSFMAGQLAHARALAAVVAPTVNSYKRLVPGYEAPVYVCWAQINRSALVRIPRYSPGRESSTRLELRCPDPSCNPYLAFSAMLAAGLEGIDHGLEAPAPTEEDVFHWDAEQLAERGVATLPGSLKEALDELAKDEVIQGALGDHAYAAFNRAKLEEWDEYRIRVSEWELERYLEIL
ncbi:MAG: type I glutamate--ammonia ligase [Anaerolineae bacterium]|nr:type I glutamate--ammonia ligase [Anaerolineae bacterium]